jgi:high-affinity K+ transport system ATPase subunit B
VTDPVPAPTGTVDPVTRMTSAERDQLTAHLLKMRDRLAATSHRHAAEWANDRMIELVEERERQARFLAATERTFDR